jgi:hypothetical protein
VGLSGTLLSETLGGTLLAAAALATVWAARRPAYWSFAAAGALWGLTILTRADYLLAPVAVALVLAVSAARRRNPRTALRAGLLVAAAALTVAPWSSLISEHAGHFVPVTDGDASALFVGTYLPGGGTTFGLKRALGDEVRASDPRLRDLSDFRMPATYPLRYVAARHPGMRRDAALRAEAFENLRRYGLGQPFAFTRMLAGKVRRMWLQPSEVGSVRITDATRTGHAVFVLAATLLALVALALRRDLRLALLLTPVAYTALLHAVFVAKARYNLPPLPLLAAAGCAGAVWLYRDRRRVTRRFAPTALPRAGVKVATTSSVALVRRMSRVAAAVRATRGRSVRAEVATARAPSTVPTPASRTRTRSVPPSAAV